MIKIVPIFRVLFTQDSEAEDLYCGASSGPDPISRTRGYIFFFMLNSVEHEVLNAYKYKNIKKFSLFQAQLRKAIFPAHKC